jgi:internalin A
MFRMTMMLINLRTLALAAATNLRTLDLSFCAQVSDLAPLATMVHLECLTLPYGTVTNLSPLSTLVNLQSLDINTCGRLDDLAPLSTLVNLQDLDITS